jgi:hypothetical protein
MHELVFIRGDVGEDVMVNVVDLHFVEGIDGVAVSGVGGRFKDDLEPGGVGAAFLVEEEGADISEVGSCAGFRSTMGVRSTRVESFFDFFTPRHLQFVAAVDISAMVKWFWNEMQCKAESIKLSKSASKSFSYAYSSASRSYRTYPGPHRRWRPRSFGAVGL